MQTYEEVISWIEGVPKYSKKDGLENIKKLMGRFGDPQLRYHVIHVAGTNGKGSCCAMLARILKCAGYKVGRYVSPHLVDYTERMSVNGADIPREKFLELARKVRAEAEAMQNGGENHPTFFELLTAIGFLWFAEEQVDWVVLETGMGGRLDSTNILPKPDLCLIASISLDHTKVLGSTVEAIAGEKAGIVKRGVPVVLGKNLPSVVSVIRAKAEELDAPFIYAGRVTEKILGNDENGLRLNAAGEGFRYGGLYCPLSGDFQKDNLATVLCAAEELLRQGVIADRRTVRKGLASVRWPGRMQYADYRGRKFLLDGAHNPDAARRLADYLEGLGRPVTLVFSALAKKDVAGVLSELGGCPQIRRVIFAPLAAESHAIPFAEAEQLWYTFRNDVPILCACDTKHALDLAYGYEDALRVCAGSLYFVGEILALIRK